MIVEFVVIVHVLCNGVTTTCAYVCAHVVYLSIVAWIVA